MAVWKWFGIVALLGYGGLLAALYLMQRAIMYPAPQVERTAPGSAGFPQAQELTLDTADSEKAIAWHVPARAGRPVILFFHGNGEVLAWRVPRFRALVADGTGLVALSFRGYAGSSGTPSEAGLVADGEAAYQFAATLYPPDRIVPFGYSLGSGVAVAIAARHPVPYLPVRWLLRDRYQSDRRIGAVRAPVLVMHGEKDRVIPIGFGERLFALANEPKRMVRFPDADHAYSDDAGILAAAKAFLDQLP